ncbi:siderophore ABC transporter substrate-binding protein [Alkalihalobacillus oceani]|uniref:siderophore ABC transporter substrate-binding protein n=1 Tax=Halalkalibacter oceani TaxID=1653776 RepID=UPI00203EEC5F|nr:siderophore ABC transporter substrate-binding protein [Halalkalibacter oceani]MCM3759921.1 siderophore ABC transporter substrate-binding protein [Halalkalibacter oceani]
MKKYLSFLILLLVLLVTLAACGTDASNDADTGEEESPATTEEATEEDGSGAEAESEAAEITVTHDLGETIVQKEPETVVVFDYGALETLDTLGVEVAGVAKGSSLPDYLSKYEGDEYTNVGSLKELDFETIYGLSPDLIIISGRQSEAYEELSEIAPTIFVGVDTTNYMESFTQNVELLGEIFNKEEEAQAELTKINDAIAALNEDVAELDGTGLIVLTTSGNISAYGNGSRFGILHDVFGIPAADENIEASTHGMSVSFEYIAETNPDYLFVIDRDQALDEAGNENPLINNEIVNSTNAAQNDNIIFLNPSVWYMSGGGLISVAEMVKEIHEGIQ